MTMADDIPEKPLDEPRPDEAQAAADAAAEQPAEEAAPEPAPEPTLEEKHAQLQDKLKRVEAEFVNETKRIRRQAEEGRKYAIEGVVVDLLPVIDALEGAKKGLGDDEASSAMREGLALVEQQLQSVFQRYGITAIDAEGMPFDPARHQAMMMVEREDLPPQTVCDVMRVGYELHGRVVRPSEVLVAKAPAAPEAECATDEAAADGEES